ncbi:hypothetical protein BGZ94_008830 [Podila epigama]|nr:hypothetical protein BGZ94_008830 [Podila epigama]
MVSTPLSKATHWSALAVMAMIMLQGVVLAQNCPAPVTVTTTETTTVWADGSWPTMTVTQNYFPDDCPAEPSYSCFVVTTTTLSTPFPQGTIHMVLPQSQQAQLADGSHQEPESVKKNGKHTKDHAVTSSLPTPIPMPTPTPTPTSTPTTPTASPTMTGPACVHYVTTIGLAPCPTYSRLPLNSDGCAILTSTSVALTTATAVPEVPFYKDGIDITYTYSFSYSVDSSPTPVPTVTPTKILLPVPTPVVDEDPADVVHSSFFSTAYSTAYSTEFSYTVSFDFTYGTATAPPSRATAYPELPGPSPTAFTSSPVSTPEPTPSLSSNVPKPTSTDPASTVTPSAEDVDESDPPVSEKVDNPSTPTPVNDPATPKTTDAVSDPPFTADGEPPAPTKTVPPIPSPLTPSRKPCEACAEPCLVELNVATKAEVGLLVNLFKDRIKKTLGSLQTSLEDETGANASAEGGKGIFASTSTSGHDSGSGASSGVTAAVLFRQTCQDKLREIEARQMASLKTKCERVVSSSCETGECLQSNVDKAVKLLDLMIASDLAKDTSDLRAELLQEYKKRCAEEDEKRMAAAAASVDAESKHEKRGLLSGLLGQTVGDSVNKVVDQVGGVVDQVGEVVDQVREVVSDTVKAVSPSLGQTVKGVLGPLTGSVKNIVDSFVGNCNRKGLLDFDTEAGVGLLDAITKVSLDLFNIVCVKVDAKVKVE